MEHQKGPDTPIEIDGACRQGFTILVHCGEKALASGRASSWWFGADGNRSGRHHTGMACGKCCGTHETTSGQIER